MKGADDPEKGRCPEVTLDTAKEKVNPYFTEYTTLSLKEPAVVEKPCKQLGIWVKGNSNWASVCFEIEDAEGEDFTTFYVRKVEWKSLEWGNWTMWVDFVDLVTLGSRETRSRTFVPSEVTVAFVQTLSPG